MSQIRERVRRRAAAMIAAAAIGATAGAALGQAKDSSAYDRLPKDRLIRQLSSLGMTDLLAALEAEIAPGDKSPEALALRGRIRLGLAGAMADENDRNRLIDAAAPLLREAIKAAQKDAKGPFDKRLELFRTTLELAAAIGWTRLETPHILRLRHLQGGPEDRRIILQYTKEAVELLDILKEDVADSLTDLRASTDDRMRYEPAMEDLLDQVRYNAAWVRIHRAMGLEDGAERTQLCRDAVGDLRKFTEDDQSGAKYWALYLTGVAHRIMKDHANADKFLDRSAVPEAQSAELRQQALFERARNRIEEGKGEQAEKTIEDFRKTALAIVGEEREVQVDLRVVLLRDYLFALQAAAEKDARKAGELRAKGQEVLLSFVEKYADRPGIIRAFLDMLAAKFADVKDLGKASAVVVMARAYAKADSKDPKEQEEAQALMLRVLNHPDMKLPKIAQAIRPGVFWELAQLMTARKQSTDAARYFVALAQEYPGNRMAERSAHNAVFSMNAVLAERREQNRPIGATLRLEFIRALDTFLGKWVKDTDPNDTKWFYDLGTQCAGVAEATNETAAKFHWQRKAIAAFEKVPQRIVEYMDAQHTALGLRTEVVLSRDALAAQLKADNERGAAALRKLASLLAAYEKVDLSAGGSTTAPAEDAGSEPETAPADDKALGQRAEALRKELGEALKVYSDPAALISRLNGYSAEAMKAGQEETAKAAAAEGKEKEERAAYADQLRGWASDADFLAARIKYEELSKGRKPQERDAVEKEALADLHAIGQKWPGTPVLRQAFEFRIRKLVERGETPRAIEEIKAFKAQYPEQAGELIQLVVEQVRERIRNLEKGLKEAVTTTELEQVRKSLIDYRRAFESFARDLYEQVKDLPADVSALDQKLREIDWMEKQGDWDGLLKDANQLASMGAAMRVEFGELKAHDREDLAGVLAAAKQPNVNRKQVLPDLAAATRNIVLDFRGTVQERYRRWQMYGEALNQRGLAEEMVGRSLDAKGAFQAALDLFLKAYGLDEQRRKVSAEWLEKVYRPQIEAAKAQANTMDAARRLIEEYKKELTAQGEDPAKVAEAGTLDFAFEFLRKADGPKEEKARLPRVVNLLGECWEKLLKRLRARQPVDSANVVGLARAYRGLKQYDKAMENYRRYTDGIDRVKYAKEFWRMQLERCQCHLEGYRGSGEAMSNLVLHIKQLQLNSPDDRTMGGFAEEFEVVRREAAKLAARKDAKRAP